MGYTEIHVTRAIVRKIMDLGIWDCGHSRVGGTRAEREPGHT